MQTILIDIFGLGTKYDSLLGLGDSYTPSAIWKDGPPADFYISSGALLYIGNYNWIEDEVLYWDLDRIYFSFDLSEYTEIYSAYLSSTFNVPSGFTWGENMAIGIYSNNWGPTLDAADWGVISSGTRMSINLVSGIYSEQQIGIWELNPTKLIPGEINYLMLADDNENENIADDSPDFVNKLATKMYGLGSSFPPILRVNGVKG